MKRYLSLCLLLVFFLLATGCDSPVNTVISKPTPVPQPGFTVTLYEPQAYTSFRDEKISLTGLPEGWVAELTGDEGHPVLHIAGEDNTVQLLYSPVWNGCLKTAEVKAWYEKNYGPDNMFTKMPVLTEKTTDAFFTGCFDVCFPDLGLNGFSAAVSLKTRGNGAQILAGCFTSQPDSECYVTALPYDVGTLKMNSDMGNKGSAKIDVWPYAVYEILVISVPKCEFSYAAGKLLDVLDTALVTQEVADAFNLTADVRGLALSPEVPMAWELSAAFRELVNAHGKPSEAQAMRDREGKEGIIRVTDSEDNLYRAPEEFINRFPADGYKRVLDDEFYLRQPDGFITLDK